MWNSSIVPAPVNVKVTTISSSVFEYLTILWYCMPAGGTNTASSWITCASVPKFFAMCSVKFFSTSWLCTAARIAADICVHNATSSPS